MHDHILNIVNTKMTYDEVKALAGHKVAAFCKDYRSMHATVSPVIKKLRRGTSLHHFIIIFEITCKTMIGILLAVMI